MSQYGLLELLGMEESPLHIEATNSGPPPSQTCKEQQGGDSQDKNSEKGVARPDSGIQQEKFTSTSRKVRASMDRAELDAKDPGGLGKCLSCDRRDHSQISQCEKTKEMSIAQLDARIASLTAIRTSMENEKSAEQVPEQFLGKEALERAGWNLKFCIACIKPGHEPKNCRSMRSLRLQQLTTLISLLKLVKARKEEEEKKTKKTKENSAGKVLGKKGDAIETKVTKSRDTIQPKSEDTGQSFASPAPSLSLSSLQQSSNVTITPDFNDGNKDSFSIIGDASDTHSNSFFNMGSENATSTVPGEPLSALFTPALEKSTPKTRHLQPHPGKTQLTNVPSNKYQPSSSTKLSETTISAGVADIMSTVKAGVLALSENPQLGEPGDVLSIIKSGMELAAVLLEKGLEGQDKNVKKAGTTDKINEIKYNDEW